MFLELFSAAGQFLGSARCEEFKTEAGRREALRSLNENEIEGLVVIGGNGSQSGSHAFFQDGISGGGCCIHY